MGMTRSIRSIVAALACVSLSSCLGAAGRSSGDDDWVSRYDHVASDPTWTGLKKAMLASTRMGSRRIDPDLATPVRRVRQYAH
jgi:hypothetical protein